MANREIESKKALAEAYLWVINPKTEAEKKASEILRAALSMNGFNFKTWSF